MTYCYRCGYALYITSPSPQADLTALTRVGLARFPSKRIQRDPRFTDNQLVPIAASHFPQTTTLAHHGDRADAVHANVSAFSKPYFAVVTLMTRQRSLFNDPVLSDVKTKQICNGKTREYYAHKAILCAQSSYFLKAFTGNFKVSEKHLK
jgi:hypothetical protein